MPYKKWLLLLFLVAGYLSSVFWINRSFYDERDFPVDLKDSEDWKVLGLPGFSERWENIQGYTELATAFKPWKLMMFPLTGHHDVDPKPAQNFNEWFPNLVTSINQQIDAEKVIAWYGQSTGGALILNHLELLLSEYPHLKYVFLTSPAVEPPKLGMVEAILHKIFRFPVPYHIPLSLGAGDPQRFFNTLPLGTYKRLTLELLTKDISLTKNVIKQLWNRDLKIVMWFGTDDNRYPQEAYKRFVQRVAQKGYEIENHPYSAGHILHDSPSVWNRILMQIKTFVKMPVEFE